MPSAILECPANHWNTDKVNANSSKHCQRVWTLLYQSLDKLIEAQGSADRKPQMILMPTLATGLQESACVRIPVNVHKELKRAHRGMSWRKAP